MNTYALVSESTLSAFSFPWEARFKDIVERMDTHFQRIKDLCRARHFGTSIQNNHLLHSIWNGVQEINEAIQKGQNNEQLRQNFKEDLAQGLSDMFQSFETNWIGHFDHLLKQHASPAKSKDMAFKGNLQRM